MDKLLSLIIFLPILLTVVLALVPRQYHAVFRWSTLLIAIAELGLCAFLVFQAPAGAGFSFVEKYEWINFQIGNSDTILIEYHLAADGLSLSMLLLSAIVMGIAAISSFEISRNVKTYFLLFNVLYTAVMGVFVAQDFFLFYIFYELILLPLYFLIGMWGGANREYASIKFFLYTLFGSVFMLLVMVGLYFSVIDPSTGKHTFNMLLMQDPANYVPGSLFAIDHAGLIWGMPLRFIAFIVLFIGFAIKIPVVPLHTWLPDAHVEAPTPVSIILAGVLLKVGAYALLRICYGIFPDAAIHYSYYVGLLGMISILYGALNAFQSEDLKRMVAYSSVSHMGFVLLGIASLTPEGVNGAVFQMFSHGVLSSMLFYLVGILYHRVHDRGIANFRGLAQQMPKYTGFVAIAFFASLGLPGFSGFIGEAFTLFGSFLSQSTTHMVPMWMAVAACLGIVLGAAYFLNTFQKMFFGSPAFKLAVWEQKLVDLRIKEIISLSILAVITLVLGVYPSLLFNLFDADMSLLIQKGLQRGYFMLANYPSLF